MQLALLLSLPLLVIKKNAVLMVFHIDCLFQASHSQSVVTADVSGISFYSSCQIPDTVKRGS